MYVLGEGGSEGVREEEEEGEGSGGRNSEEQTLGPVLVRGHFFNQYFGLFRLPNAFRAFLACRRWLAAPPPHLTLVLNRMIDSRDYEDLIRSSNQL